jgi:hypothetical protein
MKRSQINALLRDAIAFFEAHRFALPPFAFWSPETWARKADAATLIVERQLGWDITDFGRSAFDRVGLLLFTLRNGAPPSIPFAADLRYAEKIMIVRPDQLTPMHHHVAKTEDIINRGGGHLKVEPYRVSDDGSPGKGPVTVIVSGEPRTVEAGTIVSLEPGDSITLPRRVFHRFWADGEAVLAGEVSTINDDEADNRFLEPTSRFPRVEEDEPPLHLLVGDYAAWLDRS